MAETDHPLDSMLDLLRRLPPTKIKDNVNKLCDLCPEYADDLLGSIDQPLKVMTDKEKGRDYLCCDYNRDGDSFRSPWSNNYDPPLSDGTAPSAKLRQLEVAMNDAFDTYREMYYDGGVSSVYLWDLEDGGFAGVVLLKKALNPGNELTGSWDSLHVFEAHERGRSAKYKLTSTVILVLKTNTEPAARKQGEEVEVGDVNLSGSMTRQSEIDCPLTSQAGHIPNTGRMIEDMEIKMRNLLSEVYFGKTKDVINELRSAQGLQVKKTQDDMRRELMGALGARRG